MLSAIVAANDVVADLRSDLSGLTCLREVSLFPGLLAPSWGPQPCVAPNSGVVLCVTAQLFY